MQQLFQKDKKKKLTKPKTNKVLKNQSIGNKRIKKIVTIIINNKKRIESRQKQHKTIKGSKISRPIITSTTKKKKKKRERENQKEETMGGK